MEPWKYETAADLDRTLTEQLKGFPREPELAVFAARSIAALAIRGWLRLYHRFRVEHRDRLPADGSFIVVANHASHLDAVSLTAAFPLKRLHRVFPAAAEDYFFSSVPRAAFSAVVVNALPFDRLVDRRHSLELCRELLCGPGNVLVLFPEGTRSPSGELAEFKIGVGLLAAGSTHPVVPCYLEGGFEAWPKGRWLPRPRRLRLVIGRPLVFDHLEPGRESALQIAAELRRAVAELAPARGRRA